MEIVKENKTTKTKSRIAWIDIGKALALILIIAAHTLGGIALVLGFSFTVSLFFIASGLTGRFSASYKNILRDSVNMFKKLMLPPAVTILLLRLYDVLHQLITMPQQVDYSVLNPISYLLTLIYSRCNDVTIGSYTIGKIGILWFFATLFSAWAVMNLIITLLPAKLVPIGVIIASVSGLLMTRVGIILPLDIDIALTIVPYLYLGQLIKPYIKGDSKSSIASKPLLASILSPVKSFISRFKSELQPVIKLSLLFCVSAIIYCITYYLINVKVRVYFDIADAKFPLYPLCFVMAIAGSVITFIIASGISKFPKISVPFTAIGQNTLYLYCLHGVDFAWKNLWQLTDIMIINYMLRLIVDIAFMCAIIFILRGIKSRKSK